MPRARRDFFVQWQALLCLEALVSILAIAGLLAPLACRLAQARPQEEPSAQQPAAPPHDHRHGADSHPEQAAQAEAAHPHGANRGAVGPPAPAKGRRHMLLPWRRERQA